MPLSISHHFVVSIAMRHGENTSHAPQQPFTCIDWLLTNSNTPPSRPTTRSSKAIPSSPRLHRHKHGTQGTPRPRLVPPHNRAWHPPSNDHYVVFSPCSQGFKRLRSATLHTDGAPLNLLLPITQAQRLTYKRGYLPCLLLQPESSRQLSFIT